MVESITVITLLLTALNRLDWPTIFDRDPDESRRSALPGARLAEVLVVYQLIHTAKLRGTRAGCRAQGRGLDGGYADVRAVA